MPIVFATPITVRRAPALEPPFDDERPADDQWPFDERQPLDERQPFGDERPVRDAAAGQAVQPTLPLDWSWSGVRPPSGQRRDDGPDLRYGSTTGRPGDRNARGMTSGGTGDRGPRSVPGHRTRDGNAHHRPPRPGTRPSASAARGATMHFLSLFLEVLNGFRPPLHLRQLTAPREFLAVVEQVTRALGRVRAGGQPARVRLRKLLVCEPCPGVAEATAVLGQGNRAWALALRLERCPTGWVCTLIQVI